MRYCSASAVRNFTLFTLVVLSSHSFVLVNADGSSAQPSGSSLAPSVSPSSPAALPPPTSSSVSPQPSATQNSQSQPSSPSSSASAPSSSSSAQSSGLSASSSASQSSSVSQASSSSSSGALSSSSSSTVSLPSSAPSNTLTVPGTSAPAYPTGVYNSYSFSPNALPSHSSSSDVSAQTAVGAAADKSFKDNKGAVTAVAIMASLVGVGILGFIVFKVLKRRSRLRDEEDEMYFEKYQEPPLNTSGPSDSSYNISSATQPAAHNAYPDRAYHYGTTGNDGYGASQQYEYPPGTAYAAAAQGPQYQYPSDAGGYGAAATGNHPYAHAPNNYRPAAAPPINAQAYEPRTNHGYAQ